MSGLEANRLTNDERACLLRAARKQLLVLQDEFNRLCHLSGTAAADSAALELGCLQRAVAWLWRDQRPGDG
jgi:hypothetical protein